MLLGDLDKLVEEILDLAREHPIDDARIFVRDRIDKDIVAPAYNDGWNDGVTQAAKMVDSASREIRLTRTDQGDLRRWQS